MKRSHFNFLIIVLFTGCATSKPIFSPKIYSGNKYLHIDTLAANLANELSKNCIKYGFVIRVSSYINSKAFGPKRTAADPPKTDFAVSDRFNPASVTKVITATAVLQLLDKHKYSLDTTIAAFLPSTWVVHPSIQKVTFRWLLLHRSGFDDSHISGDDYAALKSYIQTGVDTALIGKTYLYTNAAFDLCRILIAYLDGYHDSATSNIDTETMARFVQYMQNNIYSPLGIQNVTYAPPINFQTLFYTYPPGNSHGDDFKNSSPGPGSAGVQLSLNEMAIFLFYLVNTNSLLSDAQKQLMLANDLGWDSAQQWFANFPSTVRKHSKGGLLFINGTSQGEHLFMQYYENGLMLVVMYNGIDDLDNAINTAYNNSWR